MRGIEKEEEEEETLAREKERVYLARVWREEGRGGGLRPISFSCLLWVVERAVGLEKLGMSAGRGGSCAFGFRRAEMGFQIFQKRGRLAGRGKTNFLSNYFIK